MIQLHDMFGPDGATPGRCSCGNPDPDHSRRQGGKHPRHSNWQNAYLSGPAALPAAEALWSARPHANIGIVTGAPSGLWVLDHDPDNAGPEADELLRRAMLAPTRVHRTGSGGTHLLFAMPPDFEPTASRRGLPAGIDIRGWHGQIVAPPSVSGKGPYSVAYDSPIAQAPAWLVDMIRPPEYERPAAGMPGEAAAGRGAAYAQAAMNALCAELAAAPAGTRNDTAFRVACRLHELMNAPWAELPERTALGAYLAAAAAAHHAGVVPFPESEALDVWTNKAGRHVGGAAAVLPAATIYGEALPAPPPFHPGVNGAVPAASMTALADPSMPGDAGGTTTGPPSSGQGTGPMDPVSALLGEMLTSSQLDALPNPAPLINGILDMSTTAWLIGKSGSYKSFVALDMAARIVRGEPWAGRPTRCGPVIYVVAEGAGGMKLRKRAWEATHGPIPDDLRFLPRPVYVKDVAAWNVLIEACRFLRPVMVVIDTQARVSVGLEENSNSDMMIYVAAADALKRATGACVLTIHHLGRNGTDARGASAIDGAQDTELRIERTQDLRVTVHQDKQKDSDDQGGVELELARVEGGTDPETGRDLSSLAVAKAGDSGLADPVHGESVKTVRSRALYAIIRDNFWADGGTGANIKRMFLAHDSMRALAGKSRDSIDKAWQRSWNDLVDRGLILKSVGLGQRYKILVLENQEQEGVLTRNSGVVARDAPDGWIIWQGPPDTRE